MQCHLIYSAFSDTIKSSSISSKKGVLMHAHAQKLSISLPQQQFDFVADYQSQHHYKSRSDVIQKALRLLQQMQLTHYYREANSEIDDAFEITLNDGIDDNETW